MSTTSVTPNQNDAPVIMIDPKTGKPGTVPSDKLADAQKLGYETAVKMINPNSGNPGYVAASKVDGAKSQGFVLHPDSFPKQTINPRQQDPMAKGTLATDDEVNAAAARNNANLTPQQRQALSFSDRAQDVMGTTMAAGAAAGTAALAAPVVYPLLRSTPIKVATGIGGGEALAEFLKKKITGH